MFLAGLLSVAGMLSVLTSNVTEKNVIEMVYEGYLLQIIVSNCVIIVRHLLQIIDPVTFLLIPLFSFVHIGRGRHY